MSTIDHAAPVAARAAAAARRAVYAIWLREVKRAIRDRGQLIGGVVRPLLWVLIMGIGLNPYFRGEIYGEVRFVVPYTYVQFLFPAVIALNIMYTSVQSAVSTIWDREFGFLREVLVSPMPRVAILLGKILGGTTVALFHGALVLALARFADLSMSLADLACRASALMFLLAFALTSLGVVIANRIRSFEGFGVFSNVVILPLYFLSSSIFPLDPSLTSAQTRVDLSGMAGHADRDQPAHLCDRCAARRLHPLSPVRSAARPARPGRDGGGVLPDRAARFPPGLTGAMALPAPLRRLLLALILGLLAASICCRRIRR